MNILIPHSWLLEYVDTTATPQEIQKFVSLCGPSIERIYDREGDSVYDIEVTTNRVDSMSVQGIAREVAVILQQFGKKAKFKPAKIKKIEKSEKTKALKLPTIIDEKKLCKRTLAVVLSHVDRTPTPEWMAKRLHQTEMNVHDAVIDITNYVTHELGHPCHAFDYDKVMELGGSIIIREARKGKQFTTLDGVEYTTVGGEIVFENEDGIIIDLPGIKGTANTSINADTKNVLFWIENIEAKKIRFASMTHAIRTTAAQLNEKNVDPELGLEVLQKGIELFVDLTNAQVASRIYDTFPGRKKPSSVKVPLQRISEYLGIEMPLNTIAEILEDLGCEAKMERAKTEKTSASIVVTPPTFRPDIQIPADVIEEIARIYGYHNLPSVLMDTAIPLKKPTDTNFFIENRMKRFLANIGWQEIYTYSMVSAEIAQQSGAAVADHLKIQNPLTDDRVYMRRSLIPSHEEIISQHEQRVGLSVFEFANVYAPKEGTLPDEQLHVTLVSTRKADVVKGDLEALFGTLFIKGVSFAPSLKNVGIFAQSSTISAVVKGSEKAIEIGVIGILKNGHVAIDLVMKELLKVIQTHPSYKPLPKTSEIIEDLTFTLPEETEIGPLLMDVLGLSSLISSVDVLSTYQRNTTLTITYHDPEKHLTVEEIAPLRKKVVELIIRHSKGKLVGILQ
jgi:phenylalanyl-tRNA synthetase beta chain